MSPSATLPVGPTYGGALPDLAHARLLVDPAQLLLTQIRLHAKRVRALAATFKRELRRLEPYGATGLEAIDRLTEGIATEVTHALLELDEAFALLGQGGEAITHLAGTLDVEHPEYTPAQRAAMHVTALLGDLQQRYARAQAALRAVSESLVVGANKLAIAVGRPASHGVEHLRAVIRQMRAISQATLDLCGRLDILVQHQSATLSALTHGEASGSAAEGAGSWQRE
jgi:hypothetical protein